MQVVGLGTAGRALAFLFSSMRHVVYGHDRRPVECSFCRVVDRPRRAHVTFIAMGEDDVEDALRSVAGLGGVLVISSTTPPGTTLRSPGNTAYP